MRVFTIGFTKKKARDFFDAVCGAGVDRLVDVRLNNVSQLAGFAKRDDLQYFLEVICGVEYRHLPILAPTKEILDEYRKGDGDWGWYERAFLELMAERRIEEQVSPADIENAVLLCSEHEAEQCHRRLVAEYLAGRWGDLEIVHLQ